MSEQGDQEAGKPGESMALAPGDSLPETPRGLAIAERTASALEGILRRLDFLCVHYAGVSPGVNCSQDKCRAHASTMASLASGKLVPVCADHPSPTLGPMTPQL